MLHYEKKRKKAMYFFIFLTFGIFIGFFSEYYFETLNSKSEKIYKDNNDIFSSVILFERYQNKVENDLFSNKHIDLIEIKAKKNYIIMDGLAEKLNFSPSIYLNLKIYLIKYKNLSKEYLQLEKTKLLYLDKLFKFRDEDEINNNYSGFLEKLSFLMNTNNSLLFEHFKKNHAHEFFNDHTTSRYKKFQSTFESFNKHIEIMDSKKVILEELTYNLKQKNKNFIKSTLLKQENETIKFSLLRKKIKIIMIILKFIFLILIFIVYRYGYRSIVLPLGKLTKLNHSIIQGRYNIYLSRKEYLSLSKADNTLSKLTLSFKQMADEVKHKIHMLNTELNYSNKLKKQLKKEAVSDKLTGLYNRRAAINILESLHENKNFILAFIDLDGLKHINDTLGHEYGDKFILEFSQIAKSNIRNFDFICRIGGDEFLIIFPETSIKNAKSSIDRIYNFIHKVNTMEGKKFKFDFSVGFDSYNTDDSKTVDEVIKKADSEMYKMKNMKKKII